MNNVNRNIKARLGPPRESSISVRSRVGEKVTSQYSKTEAQQFVRYSLASRFFSFKCGICGETYSFEGKGGFLVTNETTEMQNYNSSQTLVSSVLFLVLIVSIFTKNTTLLQVSLFPY